MVLSPMATNRVPKRPPKIPVFFMVSTEITKRHNDCNLYGTP